MKSSTQRALIKIRGNLWLNIILIALALANTVKGKPMDIRKTATAEDIAQIASQVKDIIFNVVAAKNEQGFELSFAKFRSKRQASAEGAVKHSGYSESSSYISSFQEDDDRRPKRSLDPIYNGIIGVQSLLQKEALMSIHPHYHRFKRVACWGGYGYGDGTGDDEIERRRRQQAARKRKAAQQSKTSTTKKTTPESEISVIDVTDETPKTVKRQTETDELNWKMDQVDINAFKFTKLMAEAI